MANHQDNYTSNFEGQDPAGNAGLFLFLNTHEHQYRPSGSDTVVHVPVPEKVDVTSANLHTTIRHIRNEHGDPILVSNGEEYRYVVKSADEYVFACVTNDSKAKYLMVNANTGVISTRTASFDSVVYVSRTSDDIFLTILNVVIGGRMPVVMDNGVTYYLASVTGTDIRFVRTDTNTGDVHVLNIAVDNTITETTFQTNEIFRILVADPVMSGLTQEEYAAIPQYKTVVLAYGIGSTQLYAYQISVGSNTWFIHQDESGYDLFKVSPTPSDPDDPTSKHAVTKTSYTYGSSAMTMREIDVSNFSTPVLYGADTWYAYEAVDSDYAVCKRHPQDWNVTPGIAIVAPSDTENDCVIRFEDFTFNTGTFPSGCPIKVFNHSKTQELTMLPDTSVSSLENHGAYELRIYGDRWLCVPILNAYAMPVTDAELQHALDTLKSRIIYTIPLGSIDRVEKISMASDGSDFRIHATLFNPTMDQDLNNNSNVVLNFGPSYKYADHLLFAIYEFDRINRIWNWVANTGEVNNTLNGTMHFPLSYRAVGKTKLESQHLYLFCVCGRLTGELETMGNQLVADIGMNSAALALATAKRNAGTFSSAASFGADFSTLDLATFAEADADSTISPNKPVRVFAAITNLDNLP